MKLSTKAKQKIAEDFIVGLKGIKEIAKEHGVSHQAVWYVMKCRYNKYERLKTIVDCRMRIRKNNTENKYLINKLSEIYDKL